jgi:hypothetical protein
MIKNKPLETVLLIFECQDSYAGNFGLLVGEKPTWSEI